MLKCIRNVEQITVEREQIVMGALGSVVFFVLNLDKFVKSCGDMKSVVSDFSSGVKNLVSKYL